MKIMLDDLHRAGAIPAPIEKGLIAAFQEAGGAISRFGNVVRDVQRRQRW
jgi:hypothetical protein